MTDFDAIFNKAQKETKNETLDLTIPKVSVDDQKYILVNILEDAKGNQIMKILGAFATQADADVQAEQIKGRIGNSAYDTYVVEMYGLATRPPKKDEISNQRYHEAELQNMIDSTAEQKKQVGQVFDTREANLENEAAETEIMKNELKALKMASNVENANEPQPVSKSVQKVPVKISQQELKQMSQKVDRPPTHFDPDDKLNVMDELACLDIAKANIAKLYESEEYQRLELSKDETRILSQNWALVSFTGKGLKQQTDTPGVIFWGVFDSSGETLRKHASKLKESNLDILIMELYTWVAIPPDEKYMESQEIHEKHLIEVLKRYKLVIDYKKELFSFRKNKLKNNPDMNQFCRNKSVLTELLEKFGNSEQQQQQSLQRVGIENEEMFLKTFPRQMRLPKFEVVDETNLKPTLNLK
jgi:hypothetical protein